VTDQRGFTLAELLVACAIVGLVLAGLVALQREWQFAHSQGIRRLESQQAGRLAMDRLTRELRTAQSIAAATGCSSPSGTGGVQALVIECYRKDGGLTAVPAEIHSVGVILETVSEEGGPAGHSAGETTSVVLSRVRLRNRNLF
jgi:prepilin-type N-terminal cleavage/methylation domain-containing protein